MQGGRVLAVHRSRSHSFSKFAEGSIDLLEGIGVNGDAHAGATVQHRWDAKRDPRKPNLRQVHLLPAELFDALAARGHVVQPGEMGENITTRGVDLLALPTGALLHLGAQAVVELTGLRDPCVQIERFQPGLMAAVLDKDAQGRVIRKAGVMALVRRAGRVHVEDAIRIELPAGEHRALAPV